MSILEKIKQVFTAVDEFITGTNNIVGKHGPEVKEFVIDTAEKLEQWIPDHGFGDVKLMAFDGALKIFVDVIRERESTTDAEAKGIWELAHFLLNGYVASQKAKGAWKRIKRDATA